jgi:hypothetical protein
MDKSDEMAAVARKATNTQKPVSRYLFFRRYRGSTKYINVYDRKI